MHDSRVIDSLSRRRFLQYAAASSIPAFAQVATPKPDYTLRIGKVTLDLAPGKTYKTTGFNGTSPGPLIRLREGQLVTIQVVNDTEHTDIVHWHGLHIPSAVDGAVEEGTPAINSLSSRVYTFVANPSGTRWYHTHGMAGRDLNRATYSGEFGFLYIEPKNEPGTYDQEHFLAFHEWDAYMTTGATGDSSLNVAYKHCSVNGHALGGGEPIAVKHGQRIMLRMLNASATVHRRIAFSGHRFRVLALDGNPVAHPVETEILELGPAERIDATVEMSQPGVWILGATDDRDRDRGLGIVFEYANQSGPAKWSTPPVARWDYRSFGIAGPRTTAEGTRIPLVFEKKWAGNHWVDYWTINGKSYPKTDPIKVKAGGNYRLIFDNRSDEAHPVHLHRHTFELAEVAGMPISGVYKDVVVVGAHQKMEVEFRAGNPGATLFHCHQQMHMDYGFMTLFEYL